MSESENSEVHGNYGAEPMVMQVIATKVRKGMLAQDQGYDEPIREVTQIHTPEGEFLAEQDDYSLNLSPAELMQIFTSVSHRVTKQFKNMDEEYTIDQYREELEKELVEELHDYIQSDQGGRRIVGQESRQG